MRHDLRLGWQPCLCCLRRWRRESEPGEDVEEDGFKDEGVELGAGLPAAALVRTVRFNTSFMCVNNNHHFLVNDVYPLEMIIQHTTADHFTFCINHMIAKKREETAIRSSMLVQFYFFGGIGRVGKKGPQLLHDIFLGRNEERRRRELRI